MFFEFDKRGRNRARGHRHSFKLPKQCCSKDVIEYFFSHRVIHELIERYDTIRDAILTCARKPTWVGLIYCMETTTKSVKTEKLKSKNGRGNFRNRGKLGWSFSSTLWWVELIFTARCYASAVLAMGLCPSVCACVCPSVSVCLSQAGVLLKRQNIGSQKQHHTIPQGL